MIIICVTLSIARANAAEQSEVVTTIAPLHSLVQGVMGDSGSAALLLEGTASPHDFQLKPSQMTLLQKAKIIFYISDNLEVFLLRALDALPASTQAVAMAEQDGMVLLPIREGGAWEVHSHDSHSHEGHSHDNAHDHGHNDPHIWLDPDNAITMVKAITKALSDVHPENRSLYKANAVALIGKIEASDAKAAARLKSVKAVPYIVFHDAYQYFEAHYGLTAVGSITLDPAQAGSAKRLSELREKASETAARCIFREPQFSSRLSSTVAENTNMKLGTLDPLGADLTPGAGLYPALLDRLAVDLANCLQD
ncbi:zinc ABC transporter substrate-binding protein [Sneathiella sp.]|uniref:zinc ABC transporter substrate-binding protein n=1 Tax=Sneathiella sp. TaxID=1964365 RepID=UPI0025E1EF9D|nr:zinc ABC transporter substrate-binding protein [Sneathiella sp.]